MEWERGENKGKVREKEMKERDRRRRAGEGRRGWTAPGVTLNRPTSKDALQESECLTAGVCLSSSK